MRFLQALPLASALLITLTVLLLGSCADGGSLRSAATSALRASSPVPAFSTTPVSATTSSAAHISSAAAPSSSTLPGRSLRVLSFNVREWTRDRDEMGEYYWRRRMEAMTRMIVDVNPDVICLQEVLPPVARYVPDGYRRVGVGVSHPIFVRDTMQTSKHSFAIFWEA